MDVFFIIILVFLVLVVCWIVAIYNDLVSQKQMVEEAFSGVDVQLIRRADLIPQMVESVKGYSDHERSTLEAITELRTQSQKLDIHDVKGKEEIENAIADTLSKLLVVVENYPDLKASENFSKLMNTLVDVEDNIQLARRYYNGSVRDMNIKVQSFPNNLIAGKLGFVEAVFFELESLADRLPPEVQFVSQ